MNKIKLCSILLFALILAGFNQQNVLAANVVVTSSADSGPNTLRDALTNASPDDRILFDVALTQSSRRALQVVAMEIQLAGSRSGIM